VEVPGLEDGFELFGDSGYLEDIAKELNGLRVAQQQSEEKIQEKDDDSNCYVSGLAVKHQWVAPQEIGEITVGPYVVDMNIMTEE